MELILISDSKLKVMLTEDDMKQYEINCDMIDFGSGTPVETRRAFWKILDEAKMKTGFDASGDRVFVQVYPSKSGGCEMFVTKLGIFIEKNRDSKIETPAGYIKNEKIKTRNEVNKKAVFMFDNIDNLLMACLRLSENGYIGKSSLYSAENTDSRGGKYYIVLDSDHLPKLFCPGEYNAVNCPASAILYLKEYCSCICTENAVLTLGVLV